jgi:hypothetical protein
MKSIHQLIDRSGLPTWVYERRVRILLETILLVACAVPVVTGWRSFVAQVLVGALRLHQAENGREKASILGRYAELNDGDPYSALAMHKQRRIKILDNRDAIMTWIWPVLAPIVSAAENSTFNLTLAAGILATLARVAFDKLAVPAWRKSRLEHRNDLRAHSTN